MSAKSTIGLVGLAVCLGCGTEPAHENRPLIDAQHRPDVVTDSRVLEAPPTYSGHRYLRGWWPWKQKGKLLMVPSEEGAWIEIVNLAARERILSLDLELLGSSDNHDDSVEVRLPDRPSFDIPLADPLDIRLPADLPLGRVAFELLFPKKPDPVVISGRFESAVAPGEVEIGVDQIVQHPNSMVDFVRRVEAGSRLVGRLTPPDGAGSDQKFSIYVQTEGGGESLAFQWPMSGWRNLFGRPTFEIPLGSESGLRRIRLLAEGTGPPAIWADLLLEGPISSGSEPSAPLGSTPNRAPRLVILYVLDALRGDFVDLRPADASRTPTLSRIAQEGVVLSRHQSVAPNTIPSTKSLFTGQIFATKGHAKMPADGPQTLAEAFAEAGYRTAAFSGNGYVSETYGTSRGFEYLSAEVVFQEYKSSGTTFNDNAARVHRAALEWIDGLEESDSAFLYLHTIHPHNPYDPPQPIRDEFVGSIDSDFEATTANLLHVKHRRKEIDGTDEERIEALYAGGLAYNDQQIARLLESLQERYPTEEILLVLTSDHGEELFDHGGVLHGYTLYREQLDIPLIFHWPTHLEPRRVDLPTVNTDLHETLRALIQAPPSGFQSGRSLWPWILGQPVQPDPYALRFAAASSVKGGIFSVQSDRFKLILAPRVGLTYGMGEGLGRSRDPEYLFDLQTDPEELHNLAGLDTLEVAWLRSRLGAWIERNLHLESGQEEPALDEATREQLRALGYLD